MRLVLRENSRKKAQDSQNFCDFCASLWLISFLIVLSCVTVSPAQQHETTGLTDFPVPAWSENGVIPPALKDHHVFVDLAKNEYVVAYPANLGSPTFEKEGPGPLRITAMSFCAT